MMNASAAVLVPLPLRRLATEPLDSPTVVARVVDWRGMCPLFSALRSVPAPAPRKTRADKAPTLEAWHAKRAKIAKMTPAQAQALRTLGAKVCGCAMCSGALHPAQTLAEHAARMAESAERNRNGWGTCLWRPAASAEAAHSGGAFDGDAWGPREGDRPVWARETSIRPSLPGPCSWKENPNAPEAPAKVA